MIRTTIDQDTYPLLEAHEPGKHPVRVAWEILRAEALLETQRWSLPDETAPRSYVVIFRFDLETLARIDTRAATYGVTPGEWCWGVLHRAMADEAAPPSKPSLNETLAPLVAHRERAGAAYEKRLAQRCAARLEKLRAAESARRSPVLVPWAEMPPPKPKPTPHPPRAPKPPKRVTLREREAREAFPEGRSSAGW